MTKTILLTLSGIFLLALISSTFAYRGQGTYRSYIPQSGSYSSNFVDTNSNGICDTYESGTRTRPLDGSLYRRGFSR